MKHKKPTGTLGFVRIGVDQPPHFTKLDFPGGKEEIERFILEATVRKAERDGLNLFHLKAHPVQNPENHFDFTLPTSNGEQYLDLMEVAPLSDTDGSYAKAPASYNQGDMADVILGLVLKKAAKYGVRMRTPLHLLMYTTDWRFRVSGETLQLVGCQLSKTEHCFSSVTHYVPDDAGDGELTMVFPESESQKQMNALDEARLRNMYVLQADVSKPLQSSDGRSMTFRLPPPPGKKLGE